MTISTLTILIGSAGLMPVIWTALILLVAIAFTVATTILMIRPFARPRSEQATFELLDEDERKIEALVARKVSLVQSLRDIEYDFSTNKISKEDYERFKKSCERQAVGIMRRLDALHGGDGDFDELIDRQVQQRLDDLSSPGKPASTTESDAGTNGAADPDQGIEQQIAEQTPPAPEALRCRSCDHPLDPQDRFCSQCGASADAVPDVVDDAPSSSSPSSEVAG